MFKAFIFVILSAMPAIAAAIVNIEKIEINSQERFAGEFLLDFKGSSGNSDTQSTSIESRMQWFEESTQFVLLNYNYAKNVGVVSSNKTFLHYRYINQSKKPKSWEAYLQIQDDEFTRLKLRSLAGGGLRFNLKNNKKSLSRIGLGVFYSEEQYDDISIGDEKITRLNVYYTYQYKINRNTYFLSTTYFQPDIENSKDYRALEQLKFEFNLSENLSYFLALDIRYDNDPLNGLDKNDSNYKSGIKYRF